MSAASPFHAAMRAALPRWVPSFLLSSIARSFRFDEAAALRQDLLDRGVRGRRLLEALPVTIESGAGGPDRIPRQGPLIIVANHPFGLLDAFLLDAVLDGVRQDLRFLANHTIRWLPELAGHVIPVNNMNRRGAAMDNAPPCCAPASGCAKAMRWSPSRPVKSPPSGCGLSASLKANGARRSAHSFRMPARRSSLSGLRAAMESLTAASALSTRCCACSCSPMKRSRSGIAASVFMSARRFRRSNSPLSPAPAPRPRSSAV